MGDGFNTSRTEKDERTLEEIIEATEKLKRVATREFYSKLRNEREKATFAMMMRMNPEALTAIRKEFFAREDSVSVEEFIYIINKHLIHTKNHSEGFALETAEQREFGSNMYELFKDIDVNGDGDLEWQEFTSFTVEKANLLNKKQKMASIAHYHDTTDKLDPSAQYRHRHDISRFVNMPNIGQFAILEDHKNAIFLFNSRLCKHFQTIVTETAPIAIEYVSEKDRDIIVTSAADMTLSTYSLDDPNPNKRYQLMSSWASPGVQMTLTYQPESKLLYSGGTSGSIYSWRIKDRNLVSTLVGHSDIVMSLINLKKLNNIASASLDKTVCVWDSYTSERILNLHGHKKGVFDLTYSPDYRLLFSCGFEHDAYVWSPFVNSLVFRLKGHHASLVGCTAVEGTPEIITGDTSGVFKLWDVRNFQCIQTFSANLSGNETKDSSKMTCFFHSKLPAGNAFQREDDSRIYAASKLLFSFDQARVVHEATSDKTNVFWIGWNEEASVFITASERNIIIWDALMGSKTVMNTNVVGEEISACCLDDRKRKVVIGNIHGKIGVYNASNGAQMKAVLDDNTTTVVALEYVDESRRFIAGYANGIIKIYDENTLEDCYSLRTFEAFNMHPELLTLSFNPQDRTVATAGASSGIARLWSYDAGKCEFELNVTGDSHEHVVTLSYLHPYPLVVTSDSMGNVAIWGSRGSKWPGIRLSGFLNQTILLAEYEPFKRSSDDEEEPPRRILPPLGVDGKEKEVNAMMGAYFAKHSKGIGGGAAASTTDTEDGKEDDLASSTTAAKHSGSELKRLRSRMTVVDHQNLEVINASMTQALAVFHQSEEKWGRVSAAQAFGWSLEHQMLFTADDLGVLRCFEIRHFLYDIYGESMLRGNPKSTCRGICATLSRSHRSAMAPIHSEFIRYLVGKPEDAMSYLGINFLWALNAHDDRILTCKTTCHGVLTSAADRLVKMWTFDGKPIGVLLQSVPPGMKSASWDLDLDVQAILDRENAELNTIIEQVDTLARRDDNPDIETMDFTGMDPGAQAAEFSRSELRKRIELTSSILGLHFPTEGETAAMGGGDDDGDSAYSMDSQSIVSSSVNTTNNNSNAGEILLGLDGTGAAGTAAGGTGAGGTGGGGMASDSRSIGSKSLESALFELKSPAPSVDYVAKTKMMTLLQRRRKASKLDVISNKYKELTGMKIVAGEEGPVVSIGGGMSEEDVSDMDRFMSISSKKKNHNNNGSSSSSNNSMHSYHDGGGDDNDNGSLNDMYSVASSISVHDIKTPESKKKSNLVKSIEKYSAKSQRTAALRESCSKYSSFQQLDDAMNGIATTTPVLSPKDREVLSAKRSERMKSLLLNLASPMDSRPASTDMLMMYATGEGSPMSTRHGITRNSFSTGNNANNSNNSINLGVGVGVGGISNSSANNNNTNTTSNLNPQSPSMEASNSNLLSHQNSFSSVNNDSALDTTSYSVENPL